MTIHTLLTPDESVVALIDHQPQMMFGVASHERMSIINNAVVLAKAAKLFNVPVVSGGDKRPQSQRSKGLYLARPRPQYRAY